MRVIIQRASSASVQVEQQTIATIGAGLLVLAGFEESDTASDWQWISHKLLRLRIFDDQHGVMNRSLSDVGGEILVVSQFTLFASSKKGNRPSWSRAARPEIAQVLFQRFVAQVEADLGLPIQTGVFGADMQVHLINDGPVTLCLDSKAPE